MIKLGFIVAIVFLMVSVKPSNAAQISEFTHCVKIADDVKRLACFDKAAGKVSTQQEPIRSANNLSEEQTSLPANTEQFGQEHLKVSEPKEEHSVNFIVKLLNKNANKRWIITFENGQVWQQKDSEYLSLAIGDSVRLSKGAFGAIFLQKDGANRKIKVRRQK